MKSPEKNGETPEQFDEAEWERLKQGGPANAIMKGREMGVSSEELDRFAQDVIVKKIQEQDLGFVYRFMKNLGIGTEDEVEAAGGKAYQFFLDVGDFGSAMAMAEDAYGKESEEWKRAYQANEVERKKTEKRERGVGEQDLRVTLSQDATFADLFAAVDAIEKEKGPGTVYLEDELWDNFNPELVEEILSFRNTQASQAATTKLVDFFEKHGYTQTDLSIYLPIDFE